MVVQVTGDPVGLDGVLAVAATEAVTLLLFLLYWEYRLLEVEKPEGQEFT